MFKELSIDKMQSFLQNLCYFKKQNNKTLNKFEQNLI